ncbi:hypothetical protein [Pandoraea norimbergensis]|uniref:Serine kinase n=1 Tax=Pandoraea norimbergensis TaxID=93219 RepID=A0ABN4JI32_9BURK|nr:hypothetical protein [Pandoraea norimbergensis]ALS60563.1 hypothetical protein AT302_13020 [Pandoraea norimbergensis]
MARPSHDLKAIDQIDQISALASIARRREVSLRTALTRATQALSEAEAAESQCRQAYEVQRDRWRDALARGGVYRQRRLNEASHSVETERAALVNALSAQDAAVSTRARAQANLQEQRALLQANARKQEKLREWLASLQASKVSHRA